MSFSNKEKLCFLISESSVKAVNQILLIKTNQQTSKKNTVKKKEEQQMIFTSICTYIQQIVTRNVHSRQWGGG